MEYVFYGIGYVICGYATFRAWACLVPPTKKADPDRFLWCPMCHENPTRASVIKENKEWFINGTHLLAVAASCFIFWPVILVFGGCVLATHSAIPKTTVKPSSEDSQDLLEEDCVGLERRKRSNHAKSF